MADGPMRRVRYQVAASLDGFIAAEDGSYDWIPMDPAIDFGALFAQFDTLIMGRRTFETMHGYDGGVDDAGVYGKETYVFSTTLDANTHPNIHVVRGDIAGTIAMLRTQRDRKDIWLFGGGNLFRQCIDLGLVDSVEVAVVPVMLGSGIPLLPKGSRVSMSLTGQRTYEGSGTVLLEYAVQQ